MIVIPKVGRILLVGIKIESRFSRNEPILRVAVAFGRHSAAM
jgi:hypothetical protein